MNRDRAIRSIAVAGGGIVGLSAACAFAGALPRTPVVVVETSPDHAALADGLPTARPSVAEFHKRIGIDEADLVRAGIATHHLGTFFEGWSATGEPWVHAFGPYGKPADAIPFDQIWLQAYSLGKALPYDCYSMGAALACAGKFVHPARDPNFIGSRFTYGLRLDPDLYRARLREHAAASGVSFNTGDLADVEKHADGAVAALRLTTGERIEADLFVDCTGPSARVISALDDNFEDWSAWMPFDRVALPNERGSDVPATADGVVATSDGWTIAWPLRGNIMRAQIGRGGEGVQIHRGRRLRPWVRNVLAMGDSATGLDPLHGFHLELAHSAILLALELLPGRDFATIETEEYNRRAELVTRRVRDFVALHYLRGPWPELHGIEPPESLAATLDQYGYRGRMPFHEEESITRDSWAASLLNLGVVPLNVEPQAIGVGLDKAIPAMERLAAEVEHVPATLPSYADYLARITR